ncbi:MAG TPA: thioesterase family protein [Smithella sp.]|nr:thioesterase family protein [Smithella sp.]
MNLYIRLILTVIRALLSKPVRCDEKTVWKGRVLPNDIDAYGHMNNGRYVTLLGLAAISAVIRTGLAKSSLKRGYLFIWDQTQAIWHRPLKLFEKFTIEVQMLHCEGRYIYATGAFIKANGKVAAQINYRTCIKSRTGENMDVLDVLRLDGLPLPAFSGPSPLPKELFSAPGTDMILWNPAGVDKPLPVAAIENEKRHHQRKIVHIPTLVNKMNKEWNSYHPGVIQDISLTGLRLSISKKSGYTFNIEDGETTLDIVIALPDKTEPFKIKCRSYRLTDNDDVIDVGAAFVDSNAAYNQLLQKYLG